MAEDSTSSLVDIPPPSQLSESIASISDSIDDDMSSIDSHDSDAEAEWQESIRQLELLLSMVLVPFIGKWIGRRCAFYAWKRFMEWKYPIQIVMRSKAAFEGAGLIGAATIS